MKKTKDEEWYIMGDNPPFGSPKNIGNNNSGVNNIGTYNSGSNNKGMGNAGHSNVGNNNSGNWNVCDNSSGYLNTRTPPLIIFDHPTDVPLTDIEFPFYFHSVKSIELVHEQDMTDKEKKENPDYHKHQGFIREINIKDSWKEAWDRATPADRRLTLKLPNFNNNKFEEITGINVELELLRDNEDSIPTK